MSTHDSLPESEDYPDLVDIEDHTINEPIETPKDDKVYLAVKEVNQKSFIYTLIHVQVILMQEEEPDPEKVKGMYKDQDGEQICTYDQNLIMNLMIYDVELTDVLIKYYAANTIAQKICSKIGADGYFRTTLGSIIEYYKGEKVVPKDDKYVTTHSGNRRIIK